VDDEQNRQEDIDTQEYPIEEWENGNKITNEMNSRRQLNEDDEMFPGVSSQKRVKLQAEQNFYNKLARQKGTKQ
jgi:hypothetical protein